MNIEQKYRLLKRERGRIYRLLAPSTRFAFAVDAWPCLLRRDLRLLADRQGGRVGR